MNKFLVYFVIYLTLVLGYFFNSGVFYDGWNFFNSFLIVFLLFVPLTLPIVLALYFRDKDPSSKSGGIGSGLVLGALISFFLVYFGLKIPSEGLGIVLLFYYWPVCFIYVFIGLIFLIIGKFSKKEKKVK